MSDYEVLIAGGGLAGLSLALQLKRAVGELRVLVVDPLSRPLPEAAFKVGESSIEVGAHYLGQELGLQSHILRDHFVKLGLRYFYGGGSNDFAARPEFGVADWLPVDSYQLDRGKLENHLRARVASDGIDLWEGATVRELRLAEGAESHSATVVHGGGPVSVTARFFVDATGRRRLLARQMGLLKHRGGCSAAWFRVEGALSVDGFVPRTNRGWHERVRRDRYYSTNHLMGRGYWVWIIPVAPSFTSVGIVVDETVVPFSEINTLERALSWLGRSEPDLERRLRERTPIDFKTMCRYTHTAKQVYSTNRWACVGEAGCFSDPYYSVGLNMIAYANHMTVTMIQSDRAGALVPSLVEHLNRYYTSLVETLSFNIQLTYRHHHDAQLMSLKTIWDFYVGWAISDPQYYHRTFLSPIQSRVVADVVARAVSTQQRMVELFADWGDRGTRQRWRFDFIDYIDDLPTLKALFLRNQPREDVSFADVLRDLRLAVDRVEELAHVIFFLIVEDVCPGRLPELRRHGWLNTEAMSLYPERWAADGLFDPVTLPRSFVELDTEIRRLFVPAGSSECPPRVAAH